MTDQVAKRLKMDAAPAFPSSSSSSPITIATHNGHFHADEALAVHMLRRHVPEYAGAGLVRTRDPAVLAGCHTVVDVGGVYDAEARRFDHHQRGFTTTFPGRPTKLSSAGLVYMHYGRAIVERRMQEQARRREKQKQKAEDEPEQKEVKKQQAADDGSTASADVDMLFRKLYGGFVEALDAHDNGIDAYDPTTLAAAQAAGFDVQKRFADGGFTLGAVVGRYNANWNDDEDGGDGAGALGEDARFELASARIGEEFDRELDYLVKAWLPARSLVRAAFAERHAFDAAGRLLVFRSQSCPWKDHLYAEEEAEAAADSTAESTAASQVLYVLYPDKDDRWRVQCVPAAKDSFVSRKPLPEAWRGHRDGALDQLLDGGVAPGAVFVHASGFIGGHRSFDGALQMAKRALEL